MSLPDAKVQKTLFDVPVLEAGYLDSQIAWHRLSRESLKEKYEQAGRDALGLICWLRLQPSEIRDSCELQKQCTTSRSSRRMLVVGEHHDLLQQRRREMQTDEFKERMRQRNGIEGTVSEFARGGGRRSRYRGLAKTSLANYFQGAAVNANRWIRLSQWQVEKRQEAA